MRDDQPPRLNQTSRINQKSGLRGSRSMSVGDWGYQIWLWRYGVLNGSAGISDQPVGRRLGGATAWTRRHEHSAERAQSTVEYAILLLGAAALALLVVAWMTKTDAVGRLFDTVFGRIISQA